MLASAKSRMKFRPLLEGMLHYRGIKAHVNGQLLSKQCWALVLVHGTPAVEVHRDDRQIPRDSLLDLPPNELLQIPGAVADQEHEQLCVAHPLRQLSLDRCFLARIPCGVEIVGIIEVESETVVLLPRQHQPVIVNVRVSVEGDERLVSIRQLCSFLVVTLNGKNRFYWVYRMLARSVSEVPLVEMNRYLRNSGNVPMSSATLKSLVRVSPIAS